MRYKDTESGISPRALPGLKGYVHVVATDEHAEDGVLISDEFTNPHKRRKMVEKRARKLHSILAAIPSPRLEGAEDAEVTLIGWGSTYGVIREAIGVLAERGRIHKGILAFPAAPGMLEWPFERQLRKGKVEVDFLTARRLFTLICALHAGQARSAG